MRVLHTADWHMNDTLGRIKRAPDIVRSLEQIARYLDTERIEVMVVAGDLFRERSDRDEMRAAVGELKRIFEPFLQRGGTMIAISGNHDSETFFETLDDALGMGGRPGINGTDAVGRLHIASRSRVLRLADSAGQVVQFVLMPYPTGRYLLDKQRHFKTVAERNSALQETYLRVLTERTKELDERLRTVLVSHVHVRGIDPHSLYHITENEDVVFNASDIPTHWSYMAYGHIHKPQCAVRGANHVRYCGSIERLDKGERADDKCVLTFEIGPNGLMEAPISLPLETTPFLEVVLGENGDPYSDLEKLEAEYAGHPQRERLLVHYTLYWRPGEHPLEAVRARLHALFPRWYDPVLKQIHAEGEGSDPDEEALDLTKVYDNICGYLERQLATDSQRALLMEMAEELMAEHKQAEQEGMAEDVELERAVILDALTAEEETIMEAANG